jgi:IS5 family transposase
MATDRAKQIYKERASTAECINAIQHNRGLTSFRVRGLKKVKAVLLWYALIHNLMRGYSLRLEAKNKSPALQAT